MNASESAQNGISVLSMGGGSANAQPAMAADDTTTTEAHHVVHVMEPVKSATNLKESQMNKLTAELLQKLKSAAQEEIMCREASDTSDAWQDLASPENVLTLIEIALPVLEQQDDYFGSLVLKARESAKKAMVKFPQPNYVLLKVAEEAGEVVQAGVHYAENRMSWQEVEGEVVQLMAMLFRLMNEGDQINGVIPPQPTTGTYRQIENDGWIEWSGGDCPVANDAVIEIKLRNGEVINHLSETKILIWVDRGMATDIIAYRVIENDGREG